MRYMLDTDICIYIIKKKPKAVLQRFKALEVGSVVMSVITRGELEYGALGSHRSNEALKTLTNLARLIPAQAISNRVVTDYADIRHALRTKGLMIGGNDLWIAAHARSEDLTLVTNNVREFSRVPELKIENWVV